MRRGRGHPVDVVADVRDAVAAGDPAAEAVAFEDGEPYPPPPWGLDIDDLSATIRAAALTGDRWPPYVVRVCMGVAVRRMSSLFRSLSARFGAIGSRSGRPRGDISGQSRYLEVPSAKKGTRHRRPGGSAVRRPRRGALGVTAVLTLPWSMNTRLTGRPVSREHQRSVAIRCLVARIDCSLNCHSPRGQ